MSAGLSHISAAFGFWFLGACFVSLGLIATLVGADVYYRIRRRVRRWKIRHELKRPIPFDIELERRRLKALVRVPWNGDLR